MSRRSFTALEAIWRTPTMRSMAFDAADSGVVGMTGAGFDAMALVPDFIRIAL